MNHPAGERRLPAPGARRKRIAILSGGDTGYARDVLRGIVTYARRHANWAFYAWRAGGLTNLAQLGDWHGDGIIGYLQSPDQLRLVKERPIALVNVGSEFDVTSLATVIPDDREVARQVFEHLRSRGVRVFAYAGRGHHWGSKLRGDCFRECVEADPECQFCAPFEARHSMKEASVHAKLVKWMSALPRPVGILGFTDDFAARLFEVARQLQLSIPDDVAIIGVDNDDLICDLVNPPLSSVDCAADEVGYEAARLLDQLMNGQAPPTHTVLVRPRGVVERQSTDVRMVDHPDVASAVTFIRKHAAEGICVADVVKAVTLSRRTLERLFQSYLGRPLNEEIQRQRVEHAKVLLARTQMSIGEIAEACAYKQPAHLTQAFRRWTGATPIEYRRRTFK